MARTVQAAGTITWRVSGSELQVLLVHRPRYDDWAWPKGKLEKGETLAECAVRETEEETGVRVALGQPLGVVRYDLGQNVRKVTSYWAARELPADSPAQAAREKIARAARSEIDEVRWVEVTAAEKLLTYLCDRVPLGELIDQYEDDKLVTWTLVVLRHGQAVKRSAWKKGKGAEEDRPLTRTGGKHARGLVPILAAYGVEDVVTSPWERCAATVRPYLEVTGLVADSRPELTEAAHARAARPVRRIVHREVTVKDAPLVLCTHRPVLPTVVETIAEHTPRRIFAKLPAHDPWLKPGEALVVHVAPRRRRSATVVALERVRPIV